MADLRMTVARYVAPDGAEQLVQVPGVPGVAGHARYDAALHKGRLQCEFCAAAVNFDPGSEIIAGGLKGPRPHFQLNAKHRHADDCLVPLRLDEGREAKDYDRTLGYRIHLNTRDFSGEFNDAAYPYERRADKKLNVKDPRLAMMEPYSIRAIDDFIRLMTKGDYHRLNKSTIIQRGTATVTWGDFFVRYARGGIDARHIRLADNLAAGKIRPVLMEVITDKPVYRRDLFDRKLHAESKPVAYVDGRGRAATIYPRVWLDNPNNTLVTMAMMEPGAYLVLGYPKLHTDFEKASGTVKHYINLSVTDPRQILRADIDAIGRKALMAAARLHARP